MNLPLAAVLMGFAAVLGGATGFGSSLVSTPLLLLAGFALPQVVPLNLTATLVTRLAVFVRLRGSVNWPRVALLGAASLPGACIGVLTVHLVPARYLKIAAGVLVVLAGLRMLSRMPERAGGARVRPVAAGMAGGYLSTTTSLNGIPPALLLTASDVPQRNFLADLAGYFVCCNAISLAILAFQGAIPVEVLLPALPVLTGSAVLGNLLGGFVGERLPPVLFRRLVVALIVVSGLVTVIGAF
ncbi:sulfite exporter TauE/SafE family protein [Sciscionella marina]|uniref:sulfite exporter TauE/SafE family protein n=1 Tax=Sciscionella marina TaxID=508770 RepID=UPI000377ADA2|nr:sulfite exporter TauE/SafE family protein [Sciscionella marina]